MLVEHAKLVAGELGRPVRLNRCHFVLRTICAEVTPDMTIWKEEIFTPVLRISPFGSEAEANGLKFEADRDLRQGVVTVCLHF